MANFYTWTDDPIIADQHKIRAIHVSELCDNMNLVRGYVTDYLDCLSETKLKSVNLGDTVYDYGFSDDPVQSDTDKPRDDHINDLRVALDDINSGWQNYHGGWSWCTQYSNDGAAAPGLRVTFDLTKVRAIHINELRDQLDLVDESMDDNTPFCGTACQVHCQTVCQSACQYSCQGCNNSTCHNQMCGAW